MTWRSTAWMALVWVLLIAYGDVTSYAEHYSFWSLKGFVLELGGLAMALLALNLYADKVYGR